MNTDQKIMKNAVADACHAMPDSLRRFIRQRSIQLTLRDASSDTDNPGLRFNFLSPNATLPYCLSLPPHQHALAPAKSGSKNEDCSQDRMEFSALNRTLTVRDWINHLRLQKRGEAEMNTAIDLMGRVCGAVSLVVYFARPKQKCRHLLSMKSDMSICCRNIHRDNGTGHVAAIADVLAATASSGM